MLQSQQSYSISTLIVSSLMVLSCNGAIEDGIYPSNNAHDLEIVEIPLNDGRHLTIHSQNLIEFSSLEETQIWEPSAQFGATIWTDPQTGISYIYKIGGESSGGKQSNDVWRSADGKHWERLDGGKSPWSERNGHTVETLNNVFYLVAGKRTDKDKGLNDVWESRDGGFTWEELEKARDFKWDPRYGHASTVAPCEEKGDQWCIYILGGITTKKEHEAWRSPDGRDWEKAGCPTGNEKASCKEARAFPAGSYFTLEESLFFLGGDEDQDSYIKHAEKKDDFSEWEIDAAKTAWAGREGIHLVEYEQELYAFGGREDNDFYNDIYQRKNYGNNYAVWDKLPTSQQRLWSGRAYAGALTHSTPNGQSYIYLLGGKDTNTTYSNEVWRSQDATNWEKISHTPPQLKQIRAVSDPEENLYLVAHYDDRTTLSQWIPGKTYYEVARSAHTLPIALQDSALFFHNGNLYLAGGQLVGGLVSDSLYYWDLTTPDSSLKKALTDLPEPMYDHQIITKDGCLYLLGGKKPDGSRAGDYLSCDNNTNFADGSGAWKMLYKPNLANFTSITDGVNIYLLGGYHTENHALVNTIQKVLHWTETTLTMENVNIPSTFSPRERPLAFFSGDDWYIVGGKDTTGQILTELYHSNDKGDTWASASLEELANNQHVPYRADILVTTQGGSTIYLVGGYAGDDQKVHLGYQSIEVS